MRFSTSEMTYTVSSGTLNPTHSLFYVPLCNVTVYIRGQKVVFMQFSFPSDCGRQKIACEWLTGPSAQMENNINGIMLYYVVGGPLDLLARQVLCSGTECLAKQVAENIQRIDLGRD